MIWSKSRNKPADGITLALCGDVMLGRGVDQILPHPCDPRLYEGHVGSAQDYVALAESANGPIPRDAGFSYVWGDALAALEAERPDLRDRESRDQHHEGRPSGAEGDQLQDEP